MKMEFFHSHPRSIRILGGNEMNGQARENVHTEVSATRRKRSRKPVTVVYENEMPEGLFEKALAEIYSRKVKNGTLSM
jgi:hypothetical protein